MTFRGSDTVSAPSSYPRVLLTNRTWLTTVAMGSWVRRHTPRSIGEPIHAQPAGFFADPENEEAGRSIIMQQRVDAAHQLVDDRRPAVRQVVAVRPATRREKARVFRDDPGDAFSTEVIHDGLQSQRAAMSFCGSKFSFSKTGGNLG